MESAAALITDIDEDGTLRAVKQALEGGSDPLAIIEELREGMAEVGRRFEAKDYFLPDLLMSSESSRARWPSSSPTCGVRLPCGVQSSWGL